MRGVKLKWPPIRGAVSYDVWRELFSLPGTGEVIGNTTSNEYLDLTPNGETEYVYKVRGVGPGGPGDYGDPILVTTGKQYQPPTGVVATLFEELIITVSWDDRPGAIFNVYSNEEEDFSTATLNTSLTTANSVNFSYDPDVPRWYWVTQTDGVQESAPSLATVGFAARPAPADAPVVTASDDQPGRIDVTWPAVEYAEFYDVFRDGVFLETVTTNSFTDEPPSIALHVVYGYKVVARNYAGSSEESNEDDGMALTPCLRRRRAWQRATALIPRWCA